jgi:hypothetical protein
MLFLYEVLRQRWCRLGHDERKQVAQRAVDDVSTMTRHGIDW